SHYLLIGAQNHDLEGIIKLYKFDGHWQDLGNLDFTRQKMGYMIECPNLVFIPNKDEDEENDSNEKKPVLIFCPQGLDKSVLNYESIYPNTYVIGESFDIENASLFQPSELSNLDEGFDCYATQAFNAPDGRAYAISWLGLPDTNYATDRYGYQGALSLVKELSFKNQKLIQKPVKALRSLRESKIQITLSSDKGFSSQNCYELEISDFQNPQILYFFADSLGKAALEVQINPESVKLIRNSANDKETREFPVRAQKLRLFADISTFELFINDGEKVASGRVFPNKSQQLIFSKNPMKVMIYPLKHVY
ncbi:MAG: GH32 C-terminal domain-containing protein, partial [Streptococcaceae bacterium]|nr:GH32 C-terminal domain-containing protein [Streptococcaceae bacterium]